MSAWMSLPDTFSNLRLTTNDEHVLGDNSSIYLRSYDKTGSLKEPAMWSMTYR
jgi:hypothetical protein